MPLMPLAKPAGAAPVSPCASRGAIGSKKVKTLCEATPGRSQGPVDGGPTKAVLILSRRAVAGAMAAAAAQPFSAQQAHASAARDAVKGFLRPSALTPEDALVQLLDARGTALELQVLADTPMDSDERFQARRMLPGMASALRRVQDAAPSVLSLIDANVEAELGGRYGGDAESGRNGILDSVYLAVGRVLTISGRTIKANALQQGSTACSSAAAAIDELLVLLPREPMEEAQAFRASRRR